MKTLIITILIIISISVAVQAGPDRVNPVDKQIMDYLFNANLDRADSLINLQLSEMPDHPKYYLIRANYHFYSRYFTDGLSRDSILQLIIDDSHKAIEFGEQLEETTEMKFYIGSAYGYLSRALVMSGEYWDGYWAARDCRNYLEDVLDEDPSYHDAYVGLGIIEYFTGLRYQGFYNFLVWFVGMSGDRDKGIEYFTSTYENGELFKNEAQFILGIVNRFFENDLPQAHFYLKDLQEKFPDNNFVNNQYQITLLVPLVDEKGGIDFLETEFDSLQTKYQITNVNILNLYGYYLIGQNQLDDALIVFNTNIELYPGVANCYDSMAECYLTRGDNEMAIKYYKLAWEKLKTDSTITDQFRETLTNGIPENLEELGAAIEE